MPEGESDTIVNYIIIADKIQGCRSFSKDVWQFILEHHLLTTMHPL